MINYAYEIISVDSAARVMEVVYTSEGRQPFHVGARLPFEGESLGAVIEMYAPVAYWLEQDRPTAPVEVGTTGEITTVVDTSLAAAKTRKLAELSAARFAYETGGVFYNDTLVATDRTSQAAITSAHAALRDGLVESVEWKLKDGRWLVLSLQQAAALARAVAGHVQASFSLERQLSAQVTQATTTEDVEAIQWPR